jgi:hypothetical protein
MGNAERALYSREPHRVQVSFSLFTHSGEGVQVQLRIPRAGDAECGVCPSAGSGALPFADPPAGTLEAVADQGEGIWHHFARPQSPEELGGYIRNIREIPINGAHVRHPRVQRNQMVIGGPWHAKILLGLANAMLLNPLYGKSLGVREEACAKKERG